GGGRSDHRSDCAVIHCRGGGRFAFLPRRFFSDTRLFFFTFSLFIFQSSLFFGLLRQSNSFLFGVSNGFQFRSSLSTFFFGCDLLRSEGTVFPFGIKSHHFHSTSRRETECCFGRG